MLVTGAMGIPSERAPRWRSRSSSLQVQRVRRICGLALPFAA
jgi:predicted NAD-dependent protein-ADP-ribosyltransferase YbiA (DUF1768 family)